MATIKTPINKLKKGEKIEHYNAVLLEDIKSKMELVLEKADSTEASLIAKIDEVKNELDWRLASVEKVVSGHSGQLQNIENQLADHGKQLADHGKQLADQGKQLADQGKQLADQGKQLAEIKTDVKEIKTTVKRLDEKFSEKISDHENRIVNLETARL